MAIPTRWGFSLTAEDLGPRVLAEQAARAEHLGYTDVWNAESGNLDGLSSIMAAVGTTRHVQLGTAILSVYSRTPFSMAMSAATIQDLSSGRYHLGIGSSSRRITERWHGVEFTRPLTRVREYLEVIQALLDGETVSFEGQTVSLPRARLGHQPTDRVPVWIAALGPRMLELAGTSADGVILGFMGPGGASELIPIARDAARGRDSSFHVSHRILVPYPGDDEVSLSAARRLLSGYSTVAEYRRMFERIGFAAEIDRVRQAFESGDREAAAQAVSDDLLDELFVLGSREEQFQRICAYHDAGVDVPILLYEPGPRPPDERRELIEDAMTWFGERWQQAWQEPSLKGGTLDGGGRPSA